MLYYYSSPLPGDDAEFVLTDLNDKQLAAITGKMCWHPETIKKRNQYGGLDVNPGAYYVYVRAKGILEVIEHIDQQTFRISDDPRLVKDALESKECKK
jgi:hypothetical protein